MLEGKVEYRVGKDTFVLSSGDSLTFRGAIPHRPETKLETPIKFLAIIHYDTPNLEASES
jgi:quercetin dioxygenase-like cupin family protein